MHAICVRREFVKLCAGGICSDVGREPGITDRNSRKAVTGGVTRLLPISHGRGWSIYFPDPEGNNIECFVETPWHVRQPVVSALDLSLSDEEILARTEASYKETPGFQPMQDWKDALTQRLAERWG